MGPYVARLALLPVFIVAVIAASPAACAETLAADGGDSAAKFRQSEIFQQFQQAREKLLRKVETESIDETLANLAGDPLPKMAFTLGGSIIPTPPEPILRQLYSEPRVVKLLTAAENGGDKVRLQIVRQAVNELAEFDSSGADLLPVPSGLKDGVRNTPWGYAVLLDALDSRGESLANLAKLYDNDSKWGKGVKVLSFSPGLLAFISSHILKRASTGDNPVLRLSKEDASALEAFEKSDTIGYDAVAKYEAMMAVVKRVVANYKPISASR